MHPIILLCGKSQSGKDTVGQMISKFTGAQCIALADPMKRFLGKAYGLSEVQLWGVEKEGKIMPSVPTPDMLMAAFEWATMQVSEDDLNEFSEAVLEWAGSIPSLTTPRHMLQTFGTECIRQVDPDFWIDQAMLMASILLRESHVRYDRTLGLLELADRRKAPAPTGVVITDGRFRNEILDVSEANGEPVLLKRPGVENVNDAMRAHASEESLDSIPDAWFGQVLLNDRGLEDLEFKVLNLCASWNFQPDAKKLGGTK